MVVAQGDIVWADLPDPAGSGPGLRRPVVVVPLTTTMRWAAAPGNVFLTGKQTGLPRDSVANVSQITVVDRAYLADRAGHLSAADLTLVLAGIEIVLGRE